MINGKNVMVVLPAYNAARTLGPTLAEIPPGVVDQFLLVDDASQDNTVEVARHQGNIDKHIGLDASVALTWRPLAIQNIVLRLSAAALLPGKGYEQLFGNEVAYSILGNVVLTY